MPKKKKKKVINVFCSVFNQKKKKIWAKSFVYVRIFFISAFVALNTKDYRAT